MAVRVTTLAVRKRFGDEWTDVRDFVRPRDYMVRQVVEGRSDWTPEQMWRWVVETIRYPVGSPRTLDLHTLSAFSSRIPLIGWAIPNRRYVTTDFWEFPAEVLRDREADCEGSAALLVSMLRAKWPHYPAYVTVGYFQDYGHVWVSVPHGADWRIWDTTLSEIPEVVPTERTAPEYRPLWRYHDQEVVVVDEQLIIPERTREPGKDKALRLWYRVVRDGSAA